MFVLKSLDKLICFRSLSLSFAIFISSYMHFAVTNFEITGSKNASFWHCSVLACSLLLFTVLHLIEMTTILTFFSISYFHRKSHCLTRQQAQVTGY